MAMTGRRVSIGAPLGLEDRERGRAGAVAEARLATATARRCGDRSDAPVAVARAAVVVGVVVTAVVLRDAVAGRLRRGLRGCRCRRGLRRGLRSRGAGCRAAGLLGRDLLARGGDREPVATEGVQALTLRVAGLRVHHEPIERVAVVGDLRLAVGALDRPELRSRDAAAGAQLAVRP